MIFSNKQISDIEITLTGKKIERTTEEGFLGVTMDSKLRWNSHRQKLASKLSRNAGILRKLKGIVPLNVIKLLYNSFIQAHIYYCPTIWGLGSKSSLDKIFSAQKKAIRTISENYINYYYDKKTGKPPGHTKPIFNDNQILSVHNIIYIQTLALLQKVYNNVAPAMIRNLFELNTQQTRSTQHRAVKEETFFRVPKTRKTMLDNTVFIKGPKLYNKAATEFNRSINLNIGTKSREPLFQNKFTKPFKCTIKTQTQKRQSLHVKTEWHEENFMLYQ